MVKSKYGSKEIVIDDIKFDSKDEGKYYEYLKKLKAQGKILNFELQPKYELQPGFKKNGKTYRAITYAPDFLVYHLDGTEELIDVKGMSTQQGEMRRKMFDYKYPDLKLTWVARSLKYSPTGWIGYDQLNKIRRENKKCQK
ncbi:DUF1064 domain-containing protein [Hathewaya massiliensis]|uniref:DUF1064 domain-containing protein n=1 Tax=Hathewaya massiliensis TaxID=1964382 RepID=UPI00115A866E|nr:DUF1064 domain-containing protein [Hathewaya massiliensis]